MNWEERNAEEEQRAKCMNRIAFKYPMPERWELHRGIQTTVTRHEV